MNRDRVHACLDGEVPREALTDEERTHLAALEAAIEEAAFDLRSAPVPDLTQRVMRSLPVPERARPRPSVWERTLAWLWEPRPVTIRLRPAYAMAGLAAAALAFVVVPLSAPAPSLPPSAYAEGAAPRLYVQFRLEAPGAERVELAGSFTEWQPEHELREVAPGVWTALVPLRPGVHDYTFVVDGQEWVVDPYAPRVDDSFGGSNSRLFLPSPAESA